MAIACDVGLNAISVGKTSDDRRARRDKAHVEHHVLPINSGFSRYYLALALGFFPACQTPPAQVPVALEAALLRQDRHAVLALVDRASQPLVEAALNSVAKPGASPYWLRPSPTPSRVVHTEPGETGLVVTVEADGVKRDWALVEEGGAWKVDLAATAAHRAWDVTYRDAK